MNAKYCGVECEVGMKLDGCGHYRLFPHGASKDELNDKTGGDHFKDWNGEVAGVGLKVNCPCCGKTFFVDDKDMPWGGEVTVKCENCGEEVKKEHILGDIAVEEVIQKSNGFGQKWALVRTTRGSYMLLAQPYWYKDGSASTNYVGASDEMKDWSYTQLAEMATRLVGGKGIIQWAS